MEISAKLEYGLLALLELAFHYQKQKPIGTQEIADKQHIPNRYLDQILAELKRAGITQSYRGARGGYTLTRHPREITLLDIIIALERTNAKNSDPPDTNSERKVVKQIWLSAQQENNKFLSTITLEKIYQERLKYEESTLMYYI